MAEKETSETRFPTYVSNFISLFGAAHGNASSRKLNFEFTENHLRRHIVQIDI